MKSKVFNIIYRVCDTVENYNSVRTTGKKQDIVINSFITLVKSIRFIKEKITDVNVNFHIVYDQTTDETKKFFNENLKDIVFYQYETLKTDVGNMSSLKLCYDIAKDLKGYIFFLEDDYILNEKCLYEMMSFLNMWTNDSHICLKPHQDMWMFTRDLVVNSDHYRQRELMLGSTTYWFRDISSTCTFCIDDFIFNESKENFKYTTELSRVDEYYLNEIFKKFPLFAPIMPLGIHFHSPVNFPPFFNGHEFNGIEYSTKGVLKC